MKSKMKIFFYLLSTVLLVLTSCSTDNSGNNSATNSKLLLKSDTGGIYTYDGAKIVKLSIGNGQDSNVYTYTGDLITKIDFKRGVVFDSYVYSYENNKLVMKIEKGNQGQSSLVDQYKYIYTYPSDNIILVQAYFPSNNVWKMSDGYTKYTLSSGNITKAEYFDSKGVIYATTVYEYDNKNGQFKNVLGFDKLLGLHYYDNTKNNLIKETSTWSQNTTISTYTYTYNSNEYPNSVTFKDQYGTGTDSYTYY